MRTTEEIINKIKQRREEDHLFDFFPEVLADFIPFDAAKEIVSAKWIEERGGEEKAREHWTWREPTEENIKEDMADYMKFAWGKAEDHRGLSANRSIQKMEAYTWLLGIEDAVDWDQYTPYGAPILASLCERFELPIPYSEELGRMIQGLACRDDCTECMS